MIVLSRAVQLDQDGRCAIATAKAGDAVDFHAGLAAESAATPLKSRQASGRAEMARLVTAHMNLDIGWRLAPEMREKTDDLMKPVQRLAEPCGQLGDLLRRQISMAFLDRRNWGTIMRSLDVPLNVSSLHSSDHTTIAQSVGGGTVRRSG